MAANSKHLHNMYEQMDFPDYKFEEFPKAVKVMRDGELVTIVVATQRDELEAMATLEPAPPHPAEAQVESLAGELDAKNSEIETLKAQLAKLAGDKVSAGLDKVVVTSDPKTKV